MFYLPVEKLISFPLSVYTTHHQCLKMCKCPSTFLQLQIPSLLLLELRVFVQETQTAHWLLSQYWGAALVVTVPTNFFRALKGAFMLR